MSIGALERPIYTEAFIRDTFTALSAAALVTAPISALYVSLPTGAVIIYIDAIRFSILCTYMINQPAQSTVGQSVTVSIRTHA